MRISRNSRLCSPAVRGRCAHCRHQTSSALLDHAASRLPSSTSRSSRRSSSLRRRRRGLWRRLRADGEGKFTILYERSRTWRRCARAAVDAVPSGSPRDAAVRRRDHDGPGTARPCSRALLAATKERRAPINMPTRRRAARPAADAQLHERPTARASGREPHRRQVEPPHDVEAAARAGRLDVVRGMTTQLHKEVGFQHVRVAETTRGAARGALHAAAVGARRRLRDGRRPAARRRFRVHVRISDEKKRERGAALPGLNAYFPARRWRCAAPTRRRSSCRPPRPSRSTNGALVRREARRASYTRSERAEHDLWVGAAGKRSTNHSGERSSVVAQAVNAVVASRAAGFVSPAVSMWTHFIAALMGGYHGKTSVRHRCEDLGDDAKGSHGLLCVQQPSGGGGGGGGLGRGGGGGDGGRGGGRGKSPIGGRGGGGGRGVGGRVAARAAALADQIVELRRQRDRGKLSERPIGSCWGRSRRIWALLPRRTARRAARRRRGERRRAARRDGRRAAGGQRAGPVGASASRKARRSTS